MKALIQLGLGIFVAGLLSYFYHHSFLLSGIIGGVGYVLFTLGLIGWSLEEPGDVSFS